MSWFTGKAGAGEPDAKERAARELLDPDHRRVSVSGGGRMTIVPGQVLENITHHGAS